LENFQSGDPPGDLHPNEEKGDKESKLAVNRFLFLPQRPFPLLETSEIYTETLPLPAVVKAEQEKE